ncbi:GNAT family N-acetyltransferase [Paenibacillus agilis]|uniref:GNAT family N-acetyltransferase n=1 Tax=Paenibacillus agilis TaxID=3020863 RepID=A0A559J3F9_9BACL|nr:GNAT family N-acetyltransferase [Paenibacillus agilis]TVX94401.1 GNAT family N-acetyltransferase [Paenibacillus agilis]
MIRAFRDQDKDYVIEAHGRIYKEEYQFDHTFAAYINDSVHDFVSQANREKEYIWIAEVDGNPKGMIGIARVDNDTARLRWFLVEPDARAQGLGKQLMKQAVTFSEQQQYKRIILWTHSDLFQARKLYARYGFRPVETTSKQLSGQELIEEKWELDLVE